MKSESPMDNPNSAVVRVSVRRRDNEVFAEHFLGDKNVQTEGELSNITQKAVKLLWESGKVPKI